jgi:uncharacterized protein
MDAVIVYAAASDQTDSGQCDCDCDCACASPATRLDTIELIESKLRVAPVQSFSIRSGWYGLCNPTGSPSVTALNQPAYELWHRFQEEQSLNLHTLNDEQLHLTRQMVSAGLLHQTQPAENYRPAVKDPILTSWLHLTDRCNLRCSYCYLPHVREDMSSETGYTAVDAIFRSAVANGYKRVKLKFAGGEPILRFPLIKGLYTYAGTIAEMHGIELEGVILSNGTLLTAEIIETLKTLGLRLMISMDGLGRYHDSHRSYAGGHGSFVNVSKAIDLALAHGLVPSISITVSSRTADGLPDVMRWMLDRNLPFSLNFYRENEHSAAQMDMKLDDQKIIEGMKAAFKVIEDNLPRRPFLGGIIDRANLSFAHAHTCGVGENYLVFDQNGNIAKCQMQICKPVTNIKIQDPLAALRFDKEGIQNLSVEEKEDCKSCEWKHWCAGGCPLATFRATGRYDVKSPNCNIYKALFPEALRLEGLRILKYSDKLLF